MLKIVRLQHLRERLRAVLEDQPELALRFEQALVAHDEEALARAFEGVRHAPNDQRVAVEAVILEWLFGGEAAAATDPFADHPDVSNSIH